MEAAPGWSPGTNPDFLARGPSPFLHSSRREERRPPRSCRRPSAARWWGLDGVGLTIQGADAEKAQRERRDPRSHTPSPVPLLFTKVPPWTSGSPFLSLQTTPEGAARPPLTASLGTLCPGPGSALEAAGPQGPALPLRIRVCGSGGVWRGQGSLQGRVTLTP